MFNPFYWAGWVPMVLLTVTGRRLHYTFGQHTPLSEDERFIEREVRCWWIYPTDSGFFCEELRVFRCTESCSAGSALAAAGSSLTTSQCLEMYFCE